MNWRSHILIGAILALAVFYLLGTRDILSLILVAAFGALSALVPDLDHESSKGRKLLDAFVMAFALLAVYLGGCGGIVCIPALSSVVPMIVLFFVILGVYFVLFRLFKPRHRGITHTIVACIVFGVLLFLLIGLKLAFAGAVGYFSHLLADQHVKLI